MRSLQSLPKAHLHLHAWQATLRRSTVAEWLFACDDERLQSMTLVAEQKLATIKQKQEEGKAEKRPGEFQTDVAKYERRIKAFTPPLSVDGMLGPELTAGDLPPASLHGGSGPESEIWDRQFCLDALMRTAPESQGGFSGYERQACLQLLEDAVSEGIWWIETAYKAFEFEDNSSKIEEKCATQWREALAARREAMEKFPSVGLAFVVPCPKGDLQVEQARAILEFFTAAGERGALAGIGKWGRETPGLEAELGPALSFFKEQAVPIVMLHAGEGYGATGQKIALEAYNGASHVEEAVAAGAFRIGHGIEAARSQTTMDLLQKHQVCLEVCLFSNWLLGMAPWGEEAHPLPTLIAKGVPCCLAADDPTLMGASNGHGLVREYEAARKVLKLTDQQLADLARCSIKFSCMPFDSKEKALSGIDAWLAEEDPR